MKELIAVYVKNIQRLVSISIYIIFITLMNNVPDESGAQQAIVPPKLSNKKDRVGQRSVRKCVGVSNPLYIVYGMSYISARFFRLDVKLLITVVYSRETV